MDLEGRYIEARRALEARNQQHVLDWWDELDGEQRAMLLSDIESIPWEVVDPLVPTHVLSKPAPLTYEDLEPADVLPAEPTGDRVEDYADARAQGEDLLRSGRVGAFTVAGGQGSRLGYDGPKGEIAVTPTGDRSLFCIFAETVLAARRRFDSAIPWYIMTSAANDARTREYLSENDYFGLPEADVFVFEQGMLPAFDYSGNLLLSEKHRLALAPDGHGGSLKALHRSGALDDMLKRDVAVISYFQVDNPLVKPFDPLFIGLHARAGSEMSTKVTAKVDDTEKVGNVCRSGGKLIVIEYSDFAEVYAHARNPDGSRRFDAGNLAIHLLERPFVERIAGMDFRLPFRRAEKKVPWVDAGGRPVNPDTPNAVKLEAFVFDALPLARNPMVLEVDRSEEFSPVKNATGADSLESSKRDQNQRACRWLEEAGITVPRKADGSADVCVTISPLFAINVEELRTRAGEIPPLQPGGSYYLG